MVSNQTFMGASGATVLRGDHLLRLTAVEAKVGVKKTAIYNWIKEGKFPAPLRLSPKVSVWRESDIDLWIANRCQQLMGGKQ